MQKKKKKKHQKSPGKGHGKSWNFIRSKEYEPCTKKAVQIISRLQLTSNASKGKLDAGLQVFMSSIRKH